MNISKRVVEHLKQFVAKGSKEAEAVVLDSTQQQGYIVVVTAEARGLAETRDLNVSLTLADHDRYSVTLRNLKVSYNNPPNNGSEIEDYLRQRAEQISRRVTYLEEPLELLELDAGAGLAQLRSHLPHRNDAHQDDAHRNDEAVIYWEALIQVEPHPTVSLTCYRWIPNRREREVLVYPATFATVGRLAQDLADSLVEETHV